jgi:hypothetical protein
MKKILLSILSGGLLTFIIPAATFAITPASNPAVTYVSGTITHNGSPLSGANVTVNCNGNVLNDVSKADGGYIVQYSPASLCPDGANATVSASLNDLNGSNSGPVTKLTSKLNVDVVNVAVVPELGVISAISASIIGVGAFMIVRRRGLSMQV